MFGALRSNRAQRDRTPGSGRGGNAPTSLYRLIWHFTRGRQIIIVSMSILIVPLTIAPLELQKRIIDDAILQKNLSLGAVLLGIYGLVAVTHATLLYVLNMQESRAHETMARRLRQEIMRLIRRRRAGESVDARAGTVASLFISEVDPIGEFAGQSISVPLVEGGILLAVAGYMIFTEPVLAAVTLLFFLPQFVLVPKLQHRINLRTRERVKILRGASEESIALIDGRPESKLQRVVSATRAVFDLRLKIYQLKYAMKYSVMFLISLARIAVLGVGGYLVVEGETGIGVVVAFLSGLDRLSARWSELVSFFRRMSDAIIKYDLVIDVLGKPSWGKRA